MESTNNLILILIVTLLVVMVVILITLFVFVIKLLKNMAPTNNKPVEEKKVNNILPKEPAGYCHFHDKEMAVATCAICEKLLCESCDKSDENLHFCPDHFNLFLTNKWQAITNTKTTPDDPTAGHIVYEFKNHVWNKENIPSYIVTHYRINVEFDYIESYIQLFVLEDESTNLKNRLETYPETKRQH